MFRALSFFTLLSILPRAGAFYGYMLIHCQFSSPDGHDVVYVEQFYFNKMLVGQYNSTLGKMIGYTKIAMDVADVLNKNPQFLIHEKWKTQFCQKKAHMVYSDFLTPAEPYITLRSVKPVDDKHPGMLICNIYSFYPKQIRVTWLRDGREVTSDVTSTEELSDGNWLYQIHSYLEFTPRAGEKISCMVEHASFMQPKLYDWEPVTDPGMNKLSLGIAGLLFGLVFALAGLIYYKKKSSFPHDITYMVGCFENGTTEVQYQFDSEEVLHVDFERQTVVFSVPRIITDDTEQFFFDMHVYKNALKAKRVCAAFEAFLEVEKKHPQEKKDMPRSVLYPADDVQLGIKNKLICLVNDFYPPDINVSWTRNDRPVSEGVSLSRYYPNNDQTFRQFAFLTFTPREGDNYSCTVEHSALDRPLTRIWG
ncbi:DLA class II histocompatibility antigen, partial [Nibea albiflora]